MKTCSKCKESKPLTEFNQKQSKCKDCQKTYKRSIPVLISNIYSRQKASSKKRNHIPPQYSLQSFSLWFVSQPNFQSLYDDWVESNYDKKLTPSVDRLDDYIGYSFDNIRLVTWFENYKKPYPSTFKQVFQYDKELNLINTFDSAASASRKLNLNGMYVSRYCIGKRTHPTFVFSYTKLH